MGIDTIRKQDEAEDPAKETSFPDQERSDGIEKYQDAYTKLIQGYKRDLLTEYGCSTREELQEKIQKGDIPVEEAQEIKKRVEEMPSLKEILYYYPNGVPPYKCKESYHPDWSPISEKYISVSPDRIWFLQVSFEGKIIFGGDDGQIHLINGYEDDAVDLGQHAGGNLSALQLLPDESLISIGHTITYDSAGTPSIVGSKICLWKKDESGKYTSHSITKVGEAMFAPHVVSDRCIVAGDSSGHIRHWRWDDGSGTYYTDSLLGPEISGAMSHIQCLSDGRVICGDLSRRIYLWGINDGDDQYSRILVGQHPTGRHLNESVSVLQASLNNDIYSGGSDGSIFRWSPDSSGGYSKVSVGKQPGRYFSGSRNDYFNDARKHCFAGKNYRRREV